MHVVNQYRCEYCGTLYKSEELCKQCENQHRTPVKIANVEHRPMRVCAEYPRSIQIEFDNGSVVSYERKGIVYRSKRCGSK